MTHMKVSGKSYLHKLLGHVPHDALESQKTKLAG